MADDIVKTMEKAGYTIRETDPFEDTRHITLSTRDVSPYVNRMRLMWDAMRGPVIGALPAAPGIPRDTRAYLKAVDDIYVNDAYHSLSIEGYRVSPELIERVRSGAWNPEQNPQDRENRNALAARGYYDAFVSVKASIERVLSGESAGAVSHNIRRSMHVPPRSEAVRDCMPALFELLGSEPEPAVRVVLGHFFFVYVHPYMDGNGRLGRFLMNVMLASGGYPWTIIPLESRNDYMAALESASVRQDIRPFAVFLGSLVEAGLRGQSAPPVPAARIDPVARPRRS